MKPSCTAALAVGLALALVTTAAYVAAALRPPAPGARFTGAFFYQDDYYQYLRLVEQAARGRLVFENKFDPRPHRPAVVNVEWWTAGMLSLPFGGSPVLALCRAAAGPVAPSGRGGRPRARLAGPHRQQQSTRRSRWRSGSVSSTRPASW